MLLPILIWWTGRLHSALYGNQGLQMTNCPVNNCYLTSDRKFAKNNSANVFLFYGSDIEMDDFPLPRQSSHKWALFHEESPMNMYALSHNSFITLFNYTATFKRESNFPLTTQHIPSIEYLLERPPLSLLEKNSFMFSEKTASVLYVQSHCHVASDRDRYIQKLMEYIPIDSYGKCVNNKQIAESLQDPVVSMHSQEFLDYISKYKFHLAFENAICDDYMTEKLFRALHVGSVPIYKGSSKARDYSPDHSVILVDDFKSPEDLANYILYLDENDEEYLKYLDFKTRGIKNDFLETELLKRTWSSDAVNAEPDLMGDVEPKPDVITAYQCYLCEMVTQNIGKDTATNSTRIASKSHMSCPQPYTSIGYPEDYPLNDRWLEQHWIDDYWTGLDKAIAVNEMIQAKEKNSKKFYSYFEKVGARNPK